MGSSKLNPLREELHAGDETIAAAVHSLRSLSPIACLTSWIHEPSPGIWGGFIAPSWFFFFFFSTELLQKVRYELENKGSYL